MKIKVTDLGYVPTRQYPYTYRAEVSGETMDSVEVSNWLTDNKIPHTQTAWGVFYLNKQNTEWLLLRWS